MLGCRWRGEGLEGPPHGYRLEDVERWLSEREAQTQAQGNGAGGEFLDAVRERALKERAQRHLAEQTLKVRAGELVPKDEVIGEWCARALAVRTKLVAIPSMLDLDAKTSGVLVVLVRQVLDELADGNDDPPSEIPAPPAPTAKRKRSRTRARKAKRAPARG